LGTGRVADLLREEAQSIQQGLSDSQAARALGVTQRELFTSGAVPPPLTRKPKSRWRNQGGALGFILDHKLVLAVLAISSVMLMTSFIDWHNAAISVFSFIGFGVAIGAWRSQWYLDSQMKAAEDWRFLEMWIGGAMLLLLACWGSYVILTPGYMLFSAAMEKGFNAVVWGALVGFVLAWGTLIGYCVGMGAMSRRFGFFKVAAWNFVVYPLAVAILAISLGNHLSKLPGGVQNALGIAPKNELSLPEQREPTGPRTKRAPVHPRVVPGDVPN